MLIFRTAKWLAFLLLCGAVKAESIPLIREHGTFIVPALINGQINLNFTIDSGASDVSIPADVFSTLTRTGTVSPSDLLDKQTYELADGSKQKSQRFRIRLLRVGTIELRNVVASVAPPAGSLLLGQSFLSRLKSWSIDNIRQVLLIDESPTPSPGIVTPPAPRGPPAAIAATKPSPTRGHPASIAQVNPEPIWTLLDKNDKGVELFVNPSSVIAKDNLRWADLKYVYIPKTIWGTGGFAHQWVSHGYETDEFNCDDKRYRPGLRIDHFIDKEGVESSRTWLSDSWRPARPTALNDAAMQFVCERQADITRRWRSLRKSSSTTPEILIDVSSIRIADGIRVAWFKMRPNGENVHEWFNVVSRYAFNCDEETARTEASIIYYADGTNSSDPDPLSWQPVTPDTRMSTMMGAMCSWKID